MKRALRVFLWVLGAPVVLLSVAIVAAMIMNQRAENAANELCALIHVGETEGKAVALGRLHAGRHVPGEQQHQFWFQGWPHNGSICTATIRAGLVSETAVTDVPD